MEKRHRDPTGRVCVTLNGTARPRKINPNLMDHVITANNICAQTINIQVCYLRTQNCIAMAVPAGKSKEAVLGIMASIKDFQYEFREIF